MGTLGTKYIRFEYMEPKTLNPYRLIVPLNKETLNPILFDDLATWRPLG